MQYVHDRTSPGGDDTPWWADWVYTVADSGVLVAAGILAAPGWPSALLGAGIIIYLVSAAIGWWQA